MSKCKSVVCVPHKDGRDRACNPATGRCNLVHLASPSILLKSRACSQKCTSAQVCNPATARCVKRDGVVGKRVLAGANGSSVKPKPTPKKQVTLPRKGVRFAADTKNFNGTFFSPGESSKSLMRPLRIPRRF